MPCDHHVWNFIHVVSVRLHRILADLCFISFFLSLICVSSRTVMLNCSVCFVIRFWWTNRLQRSRDVRSNGYSKRVRHFWLVDPIHLIEHVCCFYWGNVQTLLMTIINYVLLTFAECQRINLRHIFCYILLSESLSSLHFTRPRNYYYISHLNTKKSYHLWITVVTDRLWQLQSFGDTRQKRLPRSDEQNS